MALILDGVDDRAVVTGRTETLDDNFSVVLDFSVTNNEASGVVWGASTDASSPSARNVAAVLTRGSSGVPAELVARITDNEGLNESAPIGTLNNDQTYRLILINTPTELTLALDSLPEVTAVSTSEVVTLALDTFAFGSYSTNSGASWILPIGGEILNGYMWSRALTTTEKNNLKGGAHPSTISATDLISGYNFDTASSGTTYLPDAGSENLTLINGATVTDEAATGPTITDINTDESVYPGQSFVTTGTNFGATQGTGSVDIDGVAQTVTAWSDTSITCTAVRGGNEYGTGKTLTVTTDAATTATLTVAQEAEPGTFAVTAASPNTTDDASLWSGLIDTSTGDPVTVVDGDQAWVKDPNNLGNLSITPAGAISADTTGDFVVQFWRASEEVWGSDQTVSFELPGAAGGAVPDVTIDAIPPVERLIAGEGKTDGRLVPKLSTTRLATSSIAFGKQNTAAPPFDAGLPYLTQPIRVQIADFFDTGAVTEIRMPSGTAILGIHAIVLEAFDLAGADTMRMVTDQGTIVSGLDFSSTGWKLPTTYGDINAPTGLRARNVTLEPSDQNVTGSETTGDAYVFFSYIYR